MAGDPTTMREALIAEALNDIQDLITRLENVKESLGAGIEQATKEAAGKAFLSARMNFEGVINENERKLIEAGRVAAALIGNQINSGAANLLTSTASLERKAWRFIAMLGAFSLVAGVLGGYLGSKIAGM